MYSMVEEICVAKLMMTTILCFIAQCQYKYL